MERIGGGITEDTSEVTNTDSDESIKVGGELIEQTGAVAFREELEIGRRNLVQIAGPEMSEAEIGTQEKLLFAKINPKEVDTLGITGKGQPLAKIDLLGLSAEGKRYDFNLELGEKALETEVMYYLGKAETPEELFNNLHEADEQWMKIFIEKNKMSHAANIRAIYKKKIDEIIRKSNEDFEGNTSTKILTKILKEKYPQIPEETLPRIIRNARNCRSIIREIDQRKYIPGTNALPSVEEIVNKIFKAASEKIKTAKTSESYAASSEGESINHTSKTTPASSKEPTADDTPKTSLTSLIEQAVANIPQTSIVSPEGKTPKITKNSLIEPAKEIRSTLELQEKQELEEYKNYKFDIVKRNFGKEVEAECGVKIVYDEIDKLMDIATQESTEQKEEYIIDQGYMTPEELKQYHDLKKQMRRMVDDTKNKLRHTSAHIITWNYDWLTMKEKLKIKAGKNVQRKHAEEKYLGTLMRSYHSAKEDENEIFARKSTDDLRKELRKKYAEGMHEIGIDFDQWEQEYEGICQEFFEELMPKYRMGAIRWGNIPEEEKNKRTAKINQIKQRMQAQVEVGSVKIARETANSVKKTVAMRLRRASGSNVNTGIEDIFMLQSGLIVRQTNGRCAIYAIRPYDEIVTRGMGERMCKEWSETWKEMVEQRPSMIDVKFRQKVNDEIQEMAQQAQEGNFAKLFGRNKNEPDEDNPSEENTASKGVSDQHEQELTELCEQYGWVTSRIISEGSGLIIRTPSIAEVEALKKIAPKVHELIGEVAINESNAEDVTADTIKRQIKAYLGSETQISSNLYSINDNKTKTNNEDGTEKILENGKLYIDKYLDLLASCNGKIEQATSLLVADIGIHLYGKLTKQQREEFEKMMGAKLNVSKSTFYQVCGRKVDSMATRRKLVARTFFIYEFSKYIKDDSSNEMKEYFAQFVRND